ncbi:hypothetical protein, variant [Gaeumannomyces tritici R3-111a-1]|uniref:Phosphoribosylaminoimidazole-succinocarboxamide synthase n=1 Tax=Gaeumannomyces tritici (strain R3-111a-1) TaxID=644352 RepID=J3PA16_GAET3|nr:hypothetical protein, variant [Gaeumannomyces tritici R3-111a-1]EJT73501.1 hypothetical protein, variant [Gaeumannomyces tritici R3-111a-1]
MIQDFEHMERPRRGPPSSAHRPSHPLSYSRAAWTASSGSSSSSQATARQPESDAGDYDEFLRSDSPQPSLGPCAPLPFAPDPPISDSDSALDSVSDLYGPDRLYPNRLYPSPPAVILPNAVFASLRDEPDLTLDDIKEIGLQAEAQGRQAALIGMSLKDELAWEACRVTPGVDDGPYIHYAIEAITKERDGETETSTESNPLFAPDAAQRPPAALDQHRSQRSAQRQWRRPTPGAQPLSSASSMSTLVHQGPPSRMPPNGSHPPLSPQEDCVVFDMALATDRDTQRLNPPANFRPYILRPLPMAAFLGLCVLMIAALIFCAAYSLRNNGFNFAPYAGSIYGGQYFVFRILPALLGAVVLLWAQSVVVAMLRIMPFMRLASPSPAERYGAIFDDMYQPSTFLWPRLTGPWNVWLPVLVTWLMSFSLPLQSSLFAVVLVDGTWRWATVQGVAWTLVVMYLAMLGSAVVVLLFWRAKELTGAIWDPRSVADIMALVAQSGPNALKDYRGTEVLASRDELKWALRHRFIDRLAYWTTAEPSDDYWYALGALKKYDLWMQQNPDKPLAQRMSECPSASGVEKKLEGEIDIEALPHSPNVRYRYLPWCLRTPQMVGFVAAAALLLVALLVVSFLPATNIRNGFLPGLPAGPVGGAFSAANFLYSFIPSFIGMLLFLPFQALDMWVRIMQPWAELSRPRQGSRGGATPQQSVLADYAACLPIQSSWHAVRNGHWRVAVISFLSVLFVLIPVLAGGVFMALTLSTSEVRMLPLVSGFGTILALLVLYLVALCSLLPGRQDFRLPHGVTCLAEVISFVANDDVLEDPAFQGVRHKTVLRGKLGADNPDSADTWALGLGPGKDSRLGIRRQTRFTDHQRRTSRRQRRNTASAEGGVFDGADDVHV